MVVVLAQVTSVDDESSEFPSTKCMANGHLSARQSCRRRRFGKSINPRRAPALWSRNDVALMIAVTIQTIAIDRDLHMETSRGCVTDGDLARRNRRSRDGGRDNNSLRTTRRGRRNDVALMIAVAIQTIAIDRDLHMKTSRRRMADRDLSTLKCCRRRRSTPIRRSCRCGDSPQGQLSHRIWTPVCGGRNDVVNVVAVTI